MAVIHEIKTPKSDSDDILLIGKLYFSNNDKVKKDEELIEIETSKSVSNIDSPGEGFIEYFVKEGETVEVGKLILRIHDEQFEESTSKLLKDSEVDNLDQNSKVLSNSAELYIKENNLDISHIQKHFITLDDLIENYTKDVLPPNPDEISSSKYMSNIPDNTTELKISLAKQNEIKALAGVQSYGLVSTIFISVSVKKLSQEYETEFFKNSDSYLPIIIFEVSRLLKKYPLLNAYYHNGSILIYENVNVGVAFDIDDGLKVCTFKESDSMSMHDIEEYFSQCIDDYLNRSLTQEQISGSTFTVTDLSSFGVDGIIPLINNNQSAILGISSVDEQLNRINLSLSFDHRVTEGKTVGLFLSELKQRILSHTGLRQIKFKNSQNNFQCKHCMKTLEKDLSMQGVGLIKVINHEGEEELICQTCLDGWS